ncbi:MAG: hypothetical protein ACD_37C00120G0002 [uncultured bacterium]|nr:MAG: hypothetical protein ACD_37C00120G0002 [uncultured bacterium]
MKPNNKCPKCGGEFEEGVTADQMPGGAIKARWATKIRGFFLPLENKKNITSMRCKNCGYLENYAN